jgi:hypothetical protein
VRGVLISARIEGAVGRMKSSYKGDDENAKATCVEELNVTQYMECVQFGL